MLKILSTAILFVACISGSSIAANHNNNDIVIREVKLTEGFTKIIVNGNAEIVLTREASMTATIEDEETDANNTVIKNKNGILEITVTGNQHKRPFIKIPVRYIDMLEVNGNSEIRSASYLDTKDLMVFVNGECNIALRVIGTITVANSDQFELLFHKNESVKIKREG